MILCLTDLQFAPRMTLRLVVFCNRIYRDSPFLRLEDPPFSRDLAEFRCGMWQVRTCRDVTSRQQWWGLDLDIALRHAAIYDRGCIACDKDPRFCHPGYSLLGTS
jgi:hypothetical protein